MQLVSIKTVMAMLWISTAFVIGLTGSVDAFRSWTVLTGVAIVPSLLMTWHWNDTRQTMPESIQEALR